jgi:hypothetical protein
LKKCAAYFFKGEKAAAFQLRSPPAEEATLQIKKKVRKQLEPIYWRPFEDYTLLLQFTGKF